MTRTRPIRSASAGFTLLEVLIVLGLVSVMIGVAVRGFRTLTRSDVRASTAKLAGAMKYLFDRASATGRVHRLVIDLDQGMYSAEVTDDSFFLPRDKETDETRFRESEEREKERLEEERRAKAEGDFAGGAASKYQLSKYMPTEWKPKRPKFLPIKESVIKPVKVKNAKIADVFSPRLLDPMTTGKAYIYFFPLGFTEAAWIHISDPKGQGFFTLALHPLTGGVKVYSEYVAAPIQQVDDEGNLVTR